MSILVNGTVDSASSWVTVYPQGGNSQQAASGRTNGQYIDAAQVKKIAAVKGVKRVTQIVEVSYKNSGGGDPMSSSQTVEGTDLKYGYPALADAQKWSLSSGRSSRRATRTRRWSSSAPASPPISVRRPAIA